MSLLDAHLEQISLCARSIAELPYVPILCRPSTLIMPQISPA
jgi:hypothetical protein